MKRQGALGVDRAQSDRRFSRLKTSSAICFGGLFLNNVLLIIDVRTGSTLNLAVWRTIPALIGIVALLYGLIWESDRT